MRACLAQDLLELRMLKNLRLAIRNIVNSYTLNSAKIKTLLLLLTAFLTVAKCCKVEKKPQIIRIVLCSQAEKWAG